MAYLDSGNRQNGIKLKFIKRLLLTRTVMDIYYNFLIYGWMMQMARK